MSTNILSLTIITIPVQSGQVLTFNLEGINNRTPTYKWKTENEIYILYCL